MTELKPSYSGKISLEKSYLERLAGMLEPVPEVAGRLGVSRQRVLMLIREGKLEAVKLGRDYFVSSLSLQEMLDRRAARKAVSQPTTRERPERK